MRDAWRILSSPQRNKAYCQRIRPGDGSRCNPGGGANTYLETVEKVAVNGTKPRHHICVSVTHARSAGVRGNELKVTY